MNLIVQASELIKVQLQSSAKSKFDELYERHSELRLQLCYTFVSWNAIDCAQPVAVAQVTRLKQQQEEKKDNVVGGE